MAKTIYCTNRRHYLWNGLYRVNVHRHHMLHAKRVHQKLAGLTCTFLVLSDFIFLLSLNQLSYQHLQTKTVQDDMSSGLGCHESNNLDAI